MTLRLFIALLCLSGVAHAEPQRWVFAVGENRGLADDPPLQFAVADARQFAATLQEIGSVPRGNVEVTLGANADGLRRALQRFEQTLAAKAGSDDVVFVYVSSHADDGALHLDGTRFPIGELLQFLERAKAGVAVLVVDSCRSGTLTRLKGLKVAETPRATVDVETPALEGRVVITSSGANEYSQESEAVGGSYFTHHLLGGLRGPADASGDGRVTLEEAYAWAYARTMESTFATEGGLQRPAAHVDLKGTGTLVLSTPGQSGGRLVLDAVAPGEWLITSVAASGPVALVQKARGPASVALPPGRYRVKLRTDEGYREREVELPASSSVSVRVDEMQQGRLVKLASKGGREPVVSAAVVGALGSSFLRGIAFDAGGELQVSTTRLSLGPLRQLQLALGYRRGVGSAFSQHELEARLSYRLRWELWRLAVSFGPEVGGLLVLQGQVPDGTSRSGLEPYFGGALEVRCRLAGPVWLSLSGGAGALVVRKDVGVVGAFRGFGTAGVAFDL